MSFTDTNIKRLKEICELSRMERIDVLPDFPSHEMIALLARLEAAERCVDDLFETCDTTCPMCGLDDSEHSTTCEVLHHIKTWRMAAGK